MTMSPPTVDPQNGHETGGFAGLTVASFERRMGTELSRLIERHGGHPLIAPALREVPVEDNRAALAFGEQVMAGRIDMVILLTGVGTTALFELLKTRYAWPALADVLARMTLVARGPKSVAALKSVGLQPTLVVPEPNTWQDLVSTLDQHRSVRGHHIAVQEYGTPNPSLLQALEQRGAEVVAVPIYKWALPEDLGPLRHVLSRIIAGEVAVLLITNAAQVDHVMQVLEQDEQVPAFRAALRNVVVASIGPTASERLRSYAWPVDIEPSHPKMGVLVKETSTRAGTLLQGKINLSR